MKVGVYICSWIKEAPPALRAVVNGLKKHGHTIHTGNTGDAYKPCDLLVTWGTARTQINHRVAHPHQGLHLVVELGFLKRNEYRQLLFTDIAGLGIPLPRSICPHGYVGAERFNKLGIEVQDWVSGRLDHSLVLGQVPGDQSVVDCVNLTGFYQGFKNRGCHFRRHPNTRADRMTAAEVQLQKCPYEGRLEEVVRNYRETYAWSSTSGLDSLIAGVPHTAFSPYSMCPKGVRVDTESRRMQVLYNAAACQWNDEEIASGEPFEGIE